MENQKTKPIDNTESLKETYDNLNDKYLRLLAEFDNYKKRISKEKEEIKQLTKSSVLSSVLDIDSDLSIALKNQENNKGLKLIISKLDAFLKSQDIESIQTDVYDPELHEVISILKPDSSNIIDVVSKGYKLNGNPIRYPKIILG